jgi:Flavodoxin-like fold
MWWHLPPAILKGWFDRVLACGAAYTSKKRFERERFVGKRAMLSVTVGTSRSTYEHDASRLGCATPSQQRSRSGCGRLSPTFAPRYRASAGETRSRSTAWRSGGRTAASRRAPRSFAVYPSKAATRVGVTALPAWFGFFRPRTGHGAAPVAQRRDRRRGAACRPIRVP